MDCFSNHFFCGEETPYEIPLGYNWVGDISQVINENKSMLIGNSAITIKNRTRTFSLNAIIKNNTNSVGKYAFFSDGAYYPCATLEYATEGLVEENYQYTSTACLYIDTRFNNGIFREKVESIVFSAAAEATPVSFIGVSGAVPYAKFRVTAVYLTQTIQNYVVINGSRLDCGDPIVNNQTLYSEEQPLILVWPNPPSQGHFDDAEISQFGFYDYNASNGSQKISDGGDDYYFTDWMRDIGSTYREEDQAQADARYQAYYLDQGEAASSEISPKNIAIIQAPLGNMNIDRQGNTIYSFRDEGYDIYYNGITDGDLVTILQGEKNYPVGII